MENARTRSEQLEVLGFSFTETREHPLTILGIMPWRSLWSMGRGAGATAFMRSPVALAALGHELHIVHPGRPNGEGGHCFGGVHFHRIRVPDVFPNPNRPLPLRLWSRLWRYASFQAITRRHALRLGRRIKPDVVVAYGITTAPVGRAVANRLGCPFVGRYFGNTLSLALQKRLRWYGNFMERIGFRIPVNAMILTNDGSPILDVLQRLKVDRSPIHFLRNGLPANVFTPGPRPVGMLKRIDLPEDAYVLMSVTRLHSEKRLDRMIRALAALRSEVPSAVAVILGEGPEKEPLRSLANELGVADAVRFPGAVKNADLPSWYRLSDIVLSLLDRTNASNPVFEAMACERCVLAVDVGITAEVVRHEETGILVPPGNDREIVLATVRALADLAHDPQKRVAIGKRARPFILDLCGTVEERMRREIEVIEEVARTRTTVRGNLHD